MTRIALIALLTWSTCLFAPPEEAALFRGIIGREMSGAEIAQFAALIRDLHPHHDFESSVPLDEMTEEQLHAIWEKGQEFGRERIMLSEFIQRMAPRNIVKLAESYPLETVLFIHAAAENGPPMAKQLNALLFAISDPTVRRTAADSLGDSLEKDPAYRETVFNHLTDSDPKVREYLASQLHPNVRSPLSDGEHAKIVKARRLAEGDPVMTERLDFLLKHFGPRAVCKDVAGADET